MPEVDILIRGQDLASDAFERVEAAGVEAFDAIEKSAAEASSQVDNVGDKAEEAAAQGEEAAEKFSISWEKVGLALAGAGIALEIFGQKAAKQNENIDKLSVRMGIASDGIRTLAADTATSADDVNEVITLFGLAAQRGAQTEEQLQSFATFWDTLADAVGGSAEQLASYGPTLQAVGIGLGQEEKALAALGFAQTKTTAGAEGLMNMMMRGAPEIKAMGMTIDDVAAVMGILESRGLQGRAMMGEFNRASSEAKGSQQDFYKALGITNDELTTYRGKVQESATVINDLADVEAKHHTLLDRISNTVNEVMMEHGELIEKLSVLSPIFLAVAGAIGAMALAWPLLTAVFPGVAARAVAAGAAISAAIGPILLILGAVAAAAALLYLAWTENFGGIQEKTQALVDMLSSSLGPILVWVKAAFLELVAGAGEAFTTLLGIVEPVFSGILDAVLAVTEQLLADVGPAFTQIVSDVKGALEEVLPVVETIMSALADAIAWLAPYVGPVLQVIFGTAYEVTATVLGTLYNLVKGTLTRIWDTFQWLSDVISSTMAVIVGIITGDAALFEQGGRGLINAFVRGIKAMASAPLDAVRWIMAQVRALLPGSDAEEGPLSDVTASGSGMMTAMADGITEASPEVVKATEEAMARVDEAVNAIMSESRKGMTKKELEEEKKKGQDILAQRAFDNLTKLQQMEQQAAEEIAIARRTGENTAEVEKYWANQIAEEQARIQEEANKEREQRAKEAEDMEERSRRSNMTRLQQMEEDQRKAREMAEETGQDMAETELYYEKMIQEEKDRLREEEMAKEMAMVEARANIAGGFSDLLMMLYQSGEEQANTFFELAKAFAIAEAIMNAHKAATLALADTTVPSTAARMVMAGIIYAKAMMEVAAIASTKPKAMAEGGVVTKPLNALIGEAGPEAVVPLDRFDMGGGPVIQIFIQDGIWTTRPETAQELARYMRPYLDREYAR